MTIEAMRMSPSTGGGTGRAPGKAELTVVSNRLPVRRQDGEWVTSAGGLVSALTPILRDRNGIWLGWTGEPDDDIAEFTVNGIRHVSVPLTEKEIAEYYRGFSNESLWPLFHDAIRTPEYHPEWWKAYQEVNKRFALTALDNTDRAGRVWVHDYHLMTVPRFLKERAPDLSVHLFLHIPFPPVELFARLPWRRQIVEGLLAADVAGFQTERSATNFKNAAAIFADADVTSEGLVSEGGRTRVSVSPISVDAPDFARIARQSSTRRGVATVRRELGYPETVILGADRLDYTKGIDVRLRAFEVFLDRYPSYAESTRFIQVAVPSRETIGDYEEIREEVEHLAARIDGKHGSYLQTPVHYVYDSLSRDELVAYYAAADVMAVTPLADGMNLVAKEFVASRVDEDGVLILSEFAGAARELTDALMVNPYDIEGMAEQFHRAVTMAPEERSRRMRSLRRVVERNDLAAWTLRALGPNRLSTSGAEAPVDRNR